jgi:prevent-host-death family protein
MKQVSARDANQRFAEVLSAVEGGEEVLITRRGKPVAVMSPYRSELSSERRAAIEHLAEVLAEPVELGAPFRTFTRDEMHER